MGPHAAYELDAWHDFFVTTAGAAAVISGLILVSVSINLREILAWVLPVEVLR